MTLPHTPPETQARTTPGLLRPLDETTDVRSTASGRVPGLCPASVAFRLACPGLAAIVVLPYDPPKGALLDWLLYIEEHLADLGCPGATMVHEIVVALHAIREKLEVAS